MDFIAGNDIVLRSDVEQLALLPLADFTLFPVVMPFEVPDAVWATDNDFDVPLLAEGLQADSVILPFVAWGAQTRKKRMPGTYHFYVEDYRFDYLWKNPAGLVNTFCQNCVEPNFSIYDQMPLPVALWATYRKRWIARWWQSKGIKIFVDLNVAEKYAKLNLLGVPKGWKAYCTRGYQARLDATEREYALACEHAYSKDILFVVYGGGRLVSEWCKYKGIQWFDETMNERKVKVLNG